MASQSVIVPLTLKVMVSAPARALAAVIASRNDPAPLSFRFVTVNGAACAGVEGANKLKISAISDRKREV